MNVGIFQKYSMEYTVLALCPIFLTMRPKRVTFSVKVKNINFVEITATVFVVQSKTS